MTPADRLALWLAKPRNCDKVYAVGLCLPVAIAAVKSGALLALGTASLSFAYWLRFDAPIWGF